MIFKKLGCTYPKTTSPLNLQHESPSVKKNKREPDFELQALEPRILLSSEGAELLLPGAPALVETSFTAPDEGMTALPMVDGSSEEIASPMSGADQFPTGDTYTNGNAINIQGSVYLQHVPGQENLFGENTFLIDTTNTLNPDGGPSNTNGANINIDFSIQGTGFESGGILYLNAGNQGNITIGGNIGNLDQLEAIVILNANSVTISGDVRVLWFQQQAGQGNTTIGANGTKTFRTAGGDVDITTRNTLAFNSSVVVEEGGNMDLTVNPSAPVARIQFNETVVVEEGNLFIHNAKEVSFLKDVDVNGRLEQTLGTQITRFYGDVDAVDLWIRANQTIQFDQLVRSQGGDITLTSNNVKFLGGVGSVIGAADVDELPLTDLLIRPTAANVSIDIGAPLSSVGTLKFTPTDIAALANGFKSITFGYSSGALGAVRVGQANFLDPLTIHGGSIVVNGLLTSRMEMNLNVTAGPIDIDGGLVRVFNEQVESVWSDAVMNFTAQNGNIVLKNNGSLEIVQDAATDPARESRINLTALNGSILNQAGSNGLVQGRDLNAVASGNIILNTWIKTVTAHSTLLGRIDLFEVDDLHVLEATTADGRMRFDTGGNTRIDLAQSYTDDDDNTLEVEVVNGNLLLGEIRFGMTGDVFMDVEGHIRGFSSQVPPHITGDVLHLTAQQGVGESNNALRILANAVRVNNSNSGPVVLNQLAGRSQLRASIRNEGTGAGDHVSLFVSGANTVIDGTGIRSFSDGGIRVEGSSVINVEANILGEGGALTLIAGGDMSFDAGVTASSGGGDAVLFANGNLSMGATSVFASSGGNLSAQATGDILLGVLDARSASGPQSGWGHVAVKAGGFLHDSPGSAAVNFFANSLRIESVNGIGQLPSPQERSLEMDALTFAAVIGTGVIALRDVNSVTGGSVASFTPTLSLLDGGTAPGTATGALAAVRNLGGGDILLSAAGTLTVTDPADAVVTQGSGRVVMVANAITVTGTVRSSGGALSLSAAQNILLGSLITTGAANIAVSSSAGSVLAGSGSEVRTGSGTILMSAQTDMTLGVVETTGAAGLRAVTGTLRTAAGGDASRSVVTSDTLAIVAGGGVNGPTDAPDAFRTDVNTFSLLGGSGSLFRILNDGDMTIDTTSAGVDLYNELMTTAPLAIAPQSNAELTGNGSLSIVFDAGDGILADGRLIRTNGAGNLTLDAGGAFLMGADSRVQNVSGAIQLTALERITVAGIHSTSGAVTLVSTTGSIVDADLLASAADFITGGQLTLTAFTGIGIESGLRQALTVELGTLRAHSESGGIFVNSPNGFTTNGLTTAADDAPISVVAGGSLLVNAGMGGVAVAADGDLVLRADGNLVQQLGSTISARLDISLYAQNTLTIADISTPGSVAMEAVLVNGHPATGNIQLTAGGWLLEDVGTVASPATPLRTAVDVLAGTVTSGALAFHNTGNLILGEVTVTTTPPGAAVDPLVQTAGRLAVNGIGTGLFANITGNLTVDAGALSTLQVAEALPVLFQTGAGQTWNGLFDLGGGPVTFRALGDISLLADGISGTGGGSLLVQAGGSILHGADSVVNSGPAIWKSGDSVTLLGSLLSSGNVAVLAVNQILNPSAGGPVRIGGEGLILNAGHTIGGAAAISAAVSSLSAHTGAGGVKVANTGDLTITNLGFGIVSLQTNAFQGLQFSGHQGGVLAELGGIIDVTTSGTLTVEEVAAVIEVLPGGSQAISILADVTGPDGNLLSVILQIVRNDTEPIDASDAQDGSDFRSGNPPSTKFLPDTGVLQVYIRNGVSTLAEIVQAINDEALFPGTAVLAGGAFDGSGVFSLPVEAQTGFEAEGGLREGVLSQISGTFAGGLEPISAVADLQPIGEFYTLRFTALNPGAEANDFQVRLLDDGPGGRLSNFSNSAQVEFDELNGFLNIWVNFGHTTVGTVLSAVNTARDVDGLPFSVETAGSFLPSDLNDILGAPSVLLQSNLAATAVLRPTGANNDFKIVANEGGNLYNGIRVEFVDDGTLPANGASATFNPFTNVLIVLIRSGVSTASQVVEAINNEGAPSQSTFTASLVTELSGGINNGAGVIQAQRFLLGGGAVAVQASANLNFIGANNDLVITADTFGADENGIAVQMVRDASLALGAAAASYNATTRVLEIRVNPDFATAGSLLEAINNGPNAAGIPLTAAFADGQTGFGGIVLANYPLTSGGTQGPPRADFPVPGLNNDFELQAESESNELENIRAFLIDDGSITDGSATAVYLPGPRHLILNVQSGVTTLNTLIAVINAPANDIPVTATALPGNDGTGVFNLTAGQFSGGEDPVPALAATLLPSGNTVILESEIGGIANNGIQVVYGIDDTLAPGTAAASYFEGDGLRMLRIRVADANTSLNAVNAALSAAELPFFVQNASALTVGDLAPVEGDVRLTSGSHLELVGRVQSATGAVELYTTDDGDLLFSSATARIIAMTDVDIGLEGSFANLASQENPLIFIYEEGRIRILTGTNTTASTEPVNLLSRGDVEIGGAGLTLQDVDLNVEADGDILIDGPIDAGDAQIVFDAGDGITITDNGSLSSAGLSLTAGQDILQNGDLNATGEGPIVLTSTNGSILMGADSSTTSDNGNITYTAAIDIGVTFIASTGGANIVLDAGGRIYDTHASDGLNLSTGGTVWLNAFTGIGAVGAGDLKTEVGTLRLRNLGADGDIVVTQTEGGLTVTEITQQSDTGWVILNVEDGNVLFTGPVIVAGDGSLRIVSSGTLTTQAAVTLFGGGVATLQAGGSLGLNANLTTQGGDVSLVSGGTLTLSASTVVNANGGNVLLSGDDNVFLSRVISVNGKVRVVSAAGSILRVANDGLTNMIAHTLQLRAALSVGLLTLEGAALITDVDALNVIALNGVIALRNLSGAAIGESEVDVEFAQDDKSFSEGSWQEARFLTQNGNAVLRVEGGLEVEAITASLPTFSVDGNFRLNVSGALLMDGDGEVIGAAHLSSGGDLTLNGNLSISGGTLLMQSGGTLVQDGNSVVSVANANAVISSTGGQTLSRIETGTGKLALTSGGDILVAAGAPAVNLLADSLRINAAGDVGAVGNVFDIDTDFLSAHASGSIHLNAVSSLTVTTVSVSVNTVSVLGVISGDTLFTAAAQADLYSTGGGNILMQVDGTLDLRDGDSNSIAVRTVAGGHIYLQSTTLEVRANIQSVDGEITLDVSGAATFFADGSGTGRALSTGGDLHLEAATSITMQDGSVIRSSEGNVRLDSNGNIVLGSVEATIGLVSLRSLGSILDGGDTHLDVIANHLHVIATSGFGVLGAGYNAIDTRVNRVTARIANGSFAMADSNATEIGLVSGTVATVGFDGTSGSRSVAAQYGLQTLGGSSASLTAAGNITVLSSGDAEPGMLVQGAGNMLVHATAAGATLTVNDDVTAGTGHITLRAEGALAFGADVLVSTAGAGTLTLLSTTGGLTQAAGGTFSAVNGDVVIQTAGNIEISGVETLANAAITSTAGSILDNEAERVNVKANGLRLYAGTNIATGVNPLDIQASTLSSRTLNGGMFLREVDGVDVGSVSASTSLVGADALTTANNVAAQSGLLSGGTAGTIVLRSVSGDLRVLAGHPVTAAGAGNILLAASGGQVIINHAVSSGTGTITFESSGNYTLAAGILVTTGGLGQIHVLSGGLITTGANSRLVADQGNVALAAQGTIVLGGIQTTGRVTIASNTGSVFAAGSTDFAREVIAERLMLVAPLGGVGTLHPADPVQVFRTQVGRIAAQVGPGGLNVLNHAAVSVNTVEVSLSRVVDSGATSALPAAVLSNLVTVAGNGSIVLRTTTGSITLQDGLDADGVSVSAHGSGNILLHAADGMTVNADVLSGAGHITLRALNTVTFGANADLITGGTGTVYVRVSAGGLTMDGTASIGAFAIRLHTGGTIVLGNLSADGITLLSDNGSVLNATGSTLNLDAGSVRIESDVSVGAPSAPLTTGASVLSVLSRGGSIYLLELGDVSIGGVSVTVQEVLANASTTPVGESAQNGLVTQDNGNIVLVSSGGSVTVSVGSVVNAHGTGNILLQGATQLLVNGNVTSGTGSITLTGLDGLTVGSGVTISTASPGHLLMEAGSGSMTIAANAVLSAPGGNATLSAGGNILLGQLTAANASVISSAGSILRHNDGSVNITATGLLLSAQNAIGEVNNRLRIQASTLTALAATGGIYLTETDAVVINTVTVNVNRVLSTGVTELVSGTAQSDLRTLANGDIILVAGGSITLNDGNGDNTAVSANGAGRIRLDSGSNLSANLAAGIFSGSGLITLRANGNVTLTTMNIQSSGDISVQAQTGSLSMTGLANITATGATIRLRSFGNSTLGNLTAEDISVISANGSILNASGSTRNLTGNRARLDALIAIGAEDRRISTDLSLLAARSVNGGIHFTELNTLEISSAPVVITGTEFNTAGGTDAYSDGGITGVTSNGLQPVVVVSGNTLTAGIVHGSNVNLVSSTDIVSNGLSSPNITANELLLRAQGNIGSQSQFILTDTQILTANSTAGDIHIFDIGSVTVGSVLDLTTPANLSDVQSGVRALSGGGIYLAAADNLTLGLVSGGTAALGAGGAILVSAPGTTLNVDATNLLMTAGGGIGELDRHLRIRVATLAAFSAEGDILLRETNAITVGTVTVSPTAHLPASLSGLQVAGEGDIVLLAGGAVTVVNPVLANDNVRLSAVGNMTLGDVTGTDVSLLATAAVLHPDGLVTADRLRVNAGGDIQLLSRAGVLSAVSGTGSLTIVDQTETVLGSVAVTAGGVTDAAQHGLSAPLGISFTTLSGRILDGGDSADDVRSDAAVVLVGASGIGSTNSFGGLEVSAPILSASTTGAGTVYLNLTRHTDVQNISLAANGHLYLNVAGDLTQSGPIAVPQGSAFITVQGAYLGSAGLQVSRELRLSAESGALSSTAELRSATGDIQLRFQTNLNMSAGSSVVSVAGSVLVQTGGNLSAGLLQAARTLDLRVAGDLIGISTSRATHELIANALRLLVQGTVRPVLTRTARMDVRAGGVQEIFEYDSLTAGRYGFHLEDPAAKDEFVLRMGAGTLDSMLSALTLEGNVVFVLLSGTGDTVTLDANLVLPQGDIRVNTHGFLVAGTLSGTALAAPVGDVKILVPTGAGFSGVNPVVVDAATFSALAGGGDLAVRFVTPVTVTGEGVVLSAGSGTVNLIVEGGSLTLNGSVRQQGSGAVDLSVPAGGLTVNNASVTQITAGASLRINLDTGIATSGAVRLNLSAPVSSVRSREGTMRLNFLSGTQVSTEWTRILEGSGLLEIVVASGNLTMASGARIQQLGTGNLTINVQNGAFTMLADNIIRVNGALDIRVRNNFTMGIVRSFGSSTYLQSTHASILRAAGSTGANLELSSYGSHTPVINYAVTSDIWLAVNLATVNGVARNRPADQIYLILP